MRFTEYKEFELKKNNEVSIKTINIHDQLVWLVDFYRKPGDGVVSMCRIIAGQLNLSGSKETKWTWNYVHQVLNNKMIPSPKFVRTVFRLYSRECKKENIEFEQIVVVAPKGFIEKNSVVNVESKKCANPKCRLFFIPTNPVQKYCSIACKRDFNRRKSCQ